MDKSALLRRQAEFCLRLSQFSADQPVSTHLALLAARYHETALRTEFGDAGGRWGAGRRQDQTNRFSASFALICFHAQQCEN